MVVGQHGNVHALRTNESANCRRGRHPTQRTCPNDGAGAVSLSRATDHPAGIPLGGGLRHRRDRAAGIAADF
jgi:hypothetical protein